MGHVTRLSLAILVALAGAGHAEPEAPAPGASWTTPSGRGVALGFENGLWAGKLANGLRLRVPLGAHWALLARPVLVHGTGMEPYRMDLVGRLELHGATAVYFNVLRVYGGGGPSVGTEVTDTTKREVQLGLGGHVGLEAFITPVMSFFLEIGATGNTEELVTGGTATGGMLFYL
jgi:hypothetical protein